MVMLSALMGRPKNYVHDEMVSAAARAFRRHGYGGASLGILTAATGLRRGSLYAAFPDKRTLFLAALADYTRATVGHVERTLGGASDPLAGVREALRRVARVATDGEGRHGCLLTNTAAELGGRDAEIREIVAAAFARLELAYAGAFERARVAGQLEDRTDPRGLARTCIALMHGLRVLGKTGAPAAELEQIVDTVLGAVSVRRASGEPAR